MLTTSASSWTANCIANKVSKYSVKFISTCNDLMIGFAPKKVNVNQSNYTNCGWYYYTSGGSLYSQDGDSSRSFTSVDNNNGSIYGFELTSKGVINIYRAGKLLGLAYTLKDKKLAKDLIPCINCYSQNQSLEFVKGKFKK